MNTTQLYAPFLHRPETDNAHPNNDSPHGKQLRKEIQSIRRQRKYAQYLRRLRN